MEAEEGFLPILVVVLPIIVVLPILVAIVALTHNSSSNSTLASNSSKNVAGQLVVEAEEGFLSILQR